MDFISGRRIGRGYFGEETETSLKLGAKSTFVK
jgi:hypothetical protein